MMNAAAARRAVLAIALASLGACASDRIVGPTDARLVVMGRVDRSRPDRLRFGYPGVTLRLRFEGSSLGLHATSTTANSRLAVSVDGEPPRVVRLSTSDARVVLADQLGPGPHTVEVVHRTETWHGIVSVRDFELAPGGRALPPEPPSTRRLLFIGDSVTCGEGDDRQAGDCRVRDAAAISNGYASYGMVLGRALRAEVQLVCFGGRGLMRDWRGRTNVINAPQLLELAVPADARAAQTPWDHARYVPDAIVVSLGTNDFNLALGAFPAREDYVTAYVAFVGAIRAHYPDARLFLTEGAIVNDETDPSRPQKTALVDAITETVRRVGDPKVVAVAATRYPGDRCDPHPTGPQHEAMARDLLPVLRQVLGW